MKINFKEGVLTLTPENKEDSDNFGKKLIPVVKEV